MPFSEGLSPVYDHAIKPLVESLGMSCKRADEIYSPQTVLGDIWDSVQTAEIVIADLTTKNPNVMYELGLCHALWKRVILISQNKDDVPFDLRAWRVIWYDFTFAGSTRLKEELHRAIISLRQEPNMEAQILPLDKAILGDKAQEHREEWLVGRIDSWRDDKGFGFITANSETFHFSKDSMFSSEPTVFVGRNVVFKPQQRTGTGKNRHAVMVFVDGEHIHGEITKCLPDKGFSFARVKGQRNAEHEMFLLTGKNSTFEVGQIIDAAVGCDLRGPVGRHCHVVETKT